MINNVHIVDAVMGTGKSQAAINYINSSDDDVRFLYVTPFLKEVERIIASCPDKHFKQPINVPYKIDSLKYLLKKGENIVTTHVLFHMFDDDSIELCKSQGYILILDEVTDVIREYYIGKKDLQVLLKDFVDEDKKTGKLSWKESEKEYSDSKFSEEKTLCSLGCLILYKKSVLMWTFPIGIFEAFKESYVLTYLFDGQMQKCYYDYYNVKYDYLYVDGTDYTNFHFVSEEKLQKNKYNYKKLIHIVDREKLNMIGSSDNSLSVGWYEKHQDDNLIKILKNNTYNFFFNIAETKADDNIWTTFSDYKEKIKGKGYTKGFLPCNAKATNEYQDRHNVAYLINRFINPILRQFFFSFGIKADEELFALSEMLQFIWRSAIRNGEEINVYIPSARMRNLLEQWIEKNSVPNIKG